MKTQHIFLSSIILLITLFSGKLAAQSADRFDRDIRIAEGIIEELFEAEPSASRFSSRHIREVTGQYIPGYGIHFRIGANLTPAFVRVVLEEQTEIHIDEDPEPEELRELGREFVEERFMEYLKNYAPLFRQLPGDEVIRLTMGPHSYGAGVFTIRPGTAASRRTVANLTAWATASDIRAYDNRSISDGEFESRVEVVNLAERDTDRDLTVFASILQTSLQEVSDTIRVRRSPVVEHLPGLGASFTINASMRTGGWFDFGDLDINIEELRIESDSLSINISNMLDEIDFEEIGNIAERIDSAFAPDAPRFNPDSMRRSVKELRERVEQQQRTLPDETVRDLVDRFHTTLTQTVRDYGSTLRSLDNDDMLMITVNWNGRYSALPARTELRIQKSDIIDGDEPVIEEVQRR
ncbi:hypothetical protein [Rhodohalobacter sp. 8-1]|uniref:hypothetical protein n=1 Tax=Rhodohalobacter sp. 8-1 TaxID=3131972 RepID=UPI0030EE7BAE